MRANTYRCEHSKQCGPGTERCVVCGVVASGQGPDGNYYCEYDMKQTFGDVFAVLS